MEKTHIQLNLQQREGERLIERTYRFPSGSLILYSYSGFGEIVLYINKKKKIVYKVYGEIEELEKNLKSIIQKIEEDFVEVVVKRLKEINGEE